MDVLHSTESVQCSAVQTLQPRLRTESNASCEISLLTFDRHLVACAEQPNSRSSCWAVRFSQWLIGYPNCRHGSMWWWAGREGRWIDASLDKKSGELKIQIGLLAMTTTGRFLRKILFLSLKMENRVVCVSSHWKEFFNGEALEAQFTWKWCWQDANWKATSTENFSFEKKALFFLRRCDVRATLRFLFSVYFFNQIFDHIWMEGRKRENGESE